jgi:hypothetical protein
MTKIVHIYESPGEQNYVLVRGHVGGWFRDHRVPAYHSNLHNGWWVRRERRDDVLALLQRSGLPVRYSSGRAPRHLPSPVHGPEQETAA